MSAGKKEWYGMAKRKTIQPVRKLTQKDEGNRKAIQVTVIVIGVVIIALAALIIFTNN